MTPVRASHEALFGTVLEGLYRIDGLIGEGGMGAVYEASHLRLGKRVAIKVMGREFSANDEALARFHREAQVTSGLGHPHIVQVLDFSTTDDGNPFIVMEFLEGEDLDHRLRRTVRLAASELAHIVKQVASALTATHAQGIVHRDLKPGNVYLLEVAGETDFVKVLDFGISKVRTASTKLTQAAEIIGTPNYMSPEQALGRVDEVDDRTDQWALACIAWEALVGRCLFLGESAQSVLFQVVHEPTPRIDASTMDFPPQIEDVLLKALAKNKSERFASVNDFALAFERATLGVPLVPLGPPRDRTAELTAVSVPIQTSLAWTAPLSTSLPSTFTHTAVELDGVPDEIPSHAKWGWLALGGIAAALLLGGFLLLRQPPEDKPVVEAPPAAATPAPPPPTPNAEPPAAIPPSPAPTQPAEPAKTTTTAQPEPAPPTLEAQPSPGDGPGKGAARANPTPEKPPRARREDGPSPTPPQAPPKSKSKILRTL